MGQFYDAIPPNILAWLDKQRCFWVCSAPLAGDGHVNVSPKGIRDTWEFVGDKAFWYQDMTGSGNETISHMYEVGNARITILFNAFDGAPRIVRLFGKGTVHERGSAEFDKVLPPGDPRRQPGMRAIVWVDIECVGSSCGYSVPYYKFEGDRSNLVDFFKIKEKAKTVASASADSTEPSESVSTASSSPGPATPPELYHSTDVAPNMRAYWRFNNQLSMDGLPGTKESLSQKTLGALDQVPEKFKTTSAKISRLEKDGRATAAAWRPEGRFAIRAARVVRQETARVGKDLALIALATLVLALLADRWEVVGGNEGNGFVKGLDGHLRRIRAL